MNVPIWITPGFQQRDRQESQNLNDDNFCRLPVSGRQAIFGTEKYPDGGLLINYADDDCYHGIIELKIIQELQQRRYPSTLYIL